MAQATSKTERKPRAALPLTQMGWGPRPVLDPVMAPLPPEGVAAVRAAALRILAETGVDMGSPDIARALKAAGCRVQGTQVRMAPEFVTEMIARAPGAFTLTPRNPERALAVAAEGGALHFGPISSATHIWDIERGKRLGDFAAFRDMVRLSQQFNMLHFIGGYPVEPADIPPPERHLRCMAEMLRLTDTVVHAYALDPEQAEEAMELVRLALGLSPSEFAASPRMFTNMNPVTPLKQDGAVLEAALRFARNGQAVCVTPFAVIGAQSGNLAPGRLAGAVALALAEALSALAALQWLAPGAPVLLGALLPVADARSGTPVYAGPEPARALQMMGQMARSFGLPFRASGGCTAAIPDGQSMWEMTQSLWGAQQSGAAMVYHAAGWLEGGLTASPEKLLMDVEILQQMVTQSDPALTAWDAQALALDAPAMPPLRGFLADLRHYEGWQADGALWTSERAHRMIARLLEDAVDPALPDSAEEALARFVADACAG